MGLVFALDFFNGLRLQDSGQFAVAIAFAWLLLGLSVLAVAGDAQEREDGEFWMGTGVYLLGSKTSQIVTTEELGGDRGREESDSS